MKKEFIFMSLRETSDGRRFGKKRCTTELFPSFRRAYASSLDTADSAYGNVSTSLPMGARYSHGDRMSYTRTLRIASDISGMSAGTAFLIALVIALKYKGATTANR